ncbi:MAG: TIGR02757 family protein [Bacteroidales bacterium]|nr:TIGR02757 family protein [Bacteroidales bacterium]
MNSQTADLLRRHAEHYETADFLVGDPSWWMHQVSGAENQEALAFLASCLSYGSRKQFMPKIGQMLEWSGGEMHRWIVDGGFEELLPEDDKRCYYRLYTKGCMNALLRACKCMLKEYGTMGCFVRRNATDGFSALHSLSAYFFSHGASNVVPKDVTSACKRLCMFLRWMVRDHSPVDLGLWHDFIDKRTLIMPLDTHVMQQAVKLGLLSCSTASMSAARRLTASLTEVFPDDPLRGDFALFGYGVEND